MHIAQAATESVHHCERYPSTDHSEYMFITLVRVSDRFGQLVIIVYVYPVFPLTVVGDQTLITVMGAGTGGAGWASAHPGKNQGGHGPPWKF